MAALTLTRTTLSSGSMGFYLRKSVRVGPFRFNFSKSGIGVSTGIKGLRVGMGPRGNYVHMGANGFYYRKTVAPTGQGKVPMDDLPRYVEDASISSAHYGDVAMHEIESGDVSRMMHSSSAELLKEIDEKEKLLPLTPLIVLVSVGALALLIWQGASGLQMVIGGCLSAMSVWLAQTLDAIRKTVVLFYDFDPTLEQAYTLLHEHAVNLADCRGVWHISASGKVHDSKYHAGASSLVERKRTKIEKCSPHFVKTNIATVAIDVGRQTLHLFPDRVLVYDSGKVGAVGYEDLEIGVSQKRFIESETVPGDAQVVDHTWQYVNKKGGPDKRFANNRELPICLYDELHFTSSSGMNEIIQLSRQGIGQGFARAVQHISHYTHAAVDQV